MRPRNSVVKAGLLCAALGLAAAPVAAASFVRGDVNQSGKVDLSDTVALLMHLFAGAPVPGDCLDAADVNDSGLVDVADAVYGLGYLFAHQPPPPAPFPACGRDETEDGLGCASFQGCGPAVVEEVRSAAAYNPHPEVGSGDLAELVAGNTAFACDFYGAVRGEKGNLFFSPYSVSVALAMLYGGARGASGEEMAAAMHFTLPQDRLHPAFNALGLELASRGEGAQGADGEGFRLNIANSIWGQTGHSFLEAYLATLAENYDAGMRLVDFKVAPEPSRLAINDWVSGATEGKIKDLVPQGAITELTRLVLTNAIYFNAAWLAPFPENLTYDGEFTLLDGGTAVVPLMRQDGAFGRMQGDGFVAVELPYDGEELSMIVVVPHAGRFAEFEAAFGAAQLGAIVRGMQPAHVRLTMPKFRFETSLSLVPVLQGLGMGGAFAPLGADFSGIDGTRDLFVTDVLHKAYVAVNEAGTEAAAATAVIVGIVSVPEPVSIDRPFLFFIRDIPAGAVLFGGRVVDPRA